MGPNAFLRNVIGEITFAELSIPLFAIATDLETGEEVVIEDGLGTPLMY